MAFVIEVPTIHDEIDGKQLSLTIGGVKAYNLDNLYKNRPDTKKPKLSKEPDYDHGLRLWERRNEGGEVIDVSDLTDDEREKLLKYRRELYRQRRYKEESHRV